MIIFQGWIFFRCKYFLSVNIFQGLRGEYFQGWTFLRGESSWYFYFPRPFFRQYKISAQNIFSLCTTCFGTQALVTCCIQLKTWAMLKMTLKRAIAMSLQEDPPTTKEQRGEYYKWGGDVGKGLGLVHGGKANVGCCNEIYEWKSKVFSNTKIMNGGFV